MRGFSVVGTDGDLGRVEDFYFDEREMGIRYVVVDTGSWLEKRLVLISPESFTRPDFEKGVFPVELTRKEIEESPPVTKDEPLSRKIEAEVVDHYDWPSYWAVGTGVVGFKGYARTIPLDVEAEREREDRDQARKNNDALETYLRSAREIDGYSIKAADGRFGHLDKLLVDDENWMIRYLVIDTRNWLPGKRVIMAPEWLDYIGWNNKELSFPMTKDEIKNAPEYDPEIPISRVYEERLYDFYEREKYWKQTENEKRSII